MRVSDALYRHLPRIDAAPPSRGGSAAVDHEAHRTFLNWAGCAAGAATHEAMEAALAGIRMLEPRRAQRAGLQAHV